LNLFHPLKILDLLRFLSIAFANLDFGIIFSLICQDGNPSYVSIGNWLFARFPALAQLLAIVFILFFI